MPVQFEAQHLGYTSRDPKAWFLLLEQRRKPAGRLYIDLTGPPLFTAGRASPWPGQRATHDHFIWTAGQSQGQPAAASRE